MSERERRARGVGDGRVVTFAARRRRSGRSSREAVGLARVAHQPTPEVRLDEQRRALLGHAYATPERGRSAVPHGERDVPEGHVERTNGTTTKPDDANEDISLVPSASAARERHPKTASRVDPNLARTRREEATPRSVGPDALGPVKHPARTTPRFEEQAVQVMRAAVVVAARRSTCWMDGEQEPSASSSVWIDTCCVGAFSGFTTRRYREKKNTCTLAVVHPLFCCFPESSF